MNNKDRIISSIGFVLTLVLPSCNAGQLNVPTFEHDPNKRIHITAYSGPTRAKLVTPTSPETLTEEHMRKVSEAGFTKILALYEGAGRQVGNDTYEIIENLSQKAQEDALIALDLAEQFDIKYYVRDWSFYGMVKQYADPTYNHPAILTDEQYDKVLKKMFDENNQYIHHPAYAGNFCHDEPFYNELDCIAVQVDLYQKYMAEQNAYGEPIVNLLPMTAGADAFGGHSYYEYVDAFKRLFVIKDIKGWAPNIRSSNTMRKGSKRQFIDPSIATSALEISPEILMSDLKTFGFIFETLCIRDLRVYSSSMGGTVSYYHDRYGLEADAVLHLRDGRYALIEIKLGSNEIEEAAAHLNEIERLVAEYNVNENQAPLRLPDLKIVLTGTPFGYKREDGVYVIPIGCLKN